jgi:hypothetical protein
MQRDRELAPGEMPYARTRLPDMVIVGRPIGQGPGGFSGAGWAGSPRKVTTSTSR